MSKLLLLYGYNAYNNRIIKRLSSFQEYLNLITPQGNNPAAYKGFIRENTNFDYQDGVYAKHIINIAKADPTYAKVEEPNYCILEQSYTEGSGENITVIKKLSRWFVIEATKTRGNQWEISLKRDVLADYYDEVLHAPAFIERGFVDINDPAIFNNEAFTYNQIKKDELLLNNTKYSGKGKGWVVGYIAKEENKHSIGPCEAIIEAPAETEQFLSLPAKLQAFITAGTGWVSSNTDFTFQYNIRVYDALPQNVFSNNLRKIGNVYERENLLPIGGSAQQYDYTNAPLIQYDSSGWVTYADFALYLFKQPDTNSVLLSRFNTWYNLNIRSDTSQTNFESYNGLIYEKDGKLYKLTVERIAGAGSTRKHGITYTGAQAQAESDSLVIAAKNFLYSTIVGNTNVTSNPNYNVSKPFVNIFRVEYGYNFISEEVDYESIKCTIPSTRRENFDAPYDIFCIPLGEVPVSDGGSIDFTTLSNVALPMARAIAITGTSSKIYDIQVLPYCPFDDILDANGNINLSPVTIEADKDYSFITKHVGGDDIKVGIILYPKTCRGTFDLSIPSNSSIYSKCLAINDSVIEKKVASETQLVRFVSPNFSSIFEINVQKNNGIVDLNVDYFLKPYTPYIHIAPYFSGLYGEDYNDPKGLVCSGDFSISTASSKWEEYQIQNKNYSLMFDRQIQNLDVNNQITKEQTIVRGALGVGTSGLTGAMSAGGGSALGGALSIAGLAVSSSAQMYSFYQDLDFLKRSQSEARSFMADMYSYQLGNIKALPYSLTRVSNLTENNKIFPFIELYECTDEEKQALRDKIKYNGMTIMRIGEIFNFIGPTGHKYVQAKLIRMLNIDDSNHVVAEIANELKEGAYFYGSDSE